MKKFEISVIVYGEELITAVSDGTKEGTVIDTNQENINYINYYIDEGRSVDIQQNRGYNRIKCGYDSPFALTAALFSLDPKRAILLKAPQEVKDYINDGIGCGRFSISDYNGI